MNNYLKHFESELEIAKRGLEKGDRLVVEHFIEPIKQIIEIFSEEYDSGAVPLAANALSNAIKKTLLFEPLSPLTGEKTEWNEVGNNVFQNNRLSPVFKDGENAKAHYLDAIIWRTQSGSCFGGAASKSDGTKVLSRQYVKFPFTPKTFYIDVIEKEVAKDDWEFYIKDEKQLEEVFKYYDEYKITK